MLGEAICYWDYRSMYPSSSQSHIIMELSEELADT